ncbi:histone-like nucleoid-structuring protein Lsr2 [Mycobacteroides stephanolepidis]|nr:Lsr2 family protein [[Mycobacterium] stephanolepidis]
MAKRVTVTIVDDVDGESIATENVEFGIDGARYEIDLSSRNAEKLRGQLNSWVEHARRVNGRRNLRGSLNPSRKRPAIDRAQSTVIRQWASKNGHAISARGRIPAEVINAFNAAN